MIRFKFGNYYIALGVHDAIKAFEIVAYLKYNKLCIFGLILQDYALCLHFEFVFMPLA